MIRTCTFILAYHHILFNCNFSFHPTIVSTTKLFHPDSKSNNVTYFATQPRTLKPVDEFFLVLVCLRLGLLEVDESHRFNVSTATVSRIFNSWIAFLESQLRPLLVWPSRDAIQKKLPKQFKKLYRNIAVL